MSPPARRREGSREVTQQLSWFRKSLTLPKDGKVTKRLLPALLLTIALLSGVAGAQTAAPTPRPHQNFVDSAGNACNACSLFSYLAGTTTPTPTYVDSTQTTQNPNPIILDAAGGANIWLNQSLAYKFVLIEGGVTQWTVDQVPGSGGAGNYCPLTGGCTFSGNITAPGFIGPLTGIASGNLPLTGGQLASPGILNIGSTINFYITTLTQLNSAISACGASPNCAFWIGAVITINSSTTFPSNSSIAFVGGAFNGSGAISMPHGSIGAASTQVVFTGANVITGLDIADPGWWGGRTSASEFANAVASLTNASGGTVLLGLGTYQSPTGGITQANIQMVGSGMPSYNSGYTALSGGTILQGVLGVSGNYDKVQNLGIDVGSAFEGATCVDGLDIANSLTPGTTAIQRPVVRDVAVLLNGTCANHGILIENTNFANIQHVKSAMGFYGLIVKSSNATARDVWTCGASSSSIYVKADSAFSGPISNILIDGFTVDNSCSVTSSGVLVEAQTSTIAGVTLDHGVVAGNSGNSLNIEGDGTSFTTSDWNIDHFKSTNSGGVCIFFTGNTARGSIDHVACNAPGGIGLISSGASFPLNISNSIVTNSPTGGFNIAGTSGSNVQLVNDQVLGTGPTPYGITCTAGIVNLINFSATNGVTTPIVNSGGTCNPNSIPSIYVAGTLLTAPIVQTYQVSMTAGTVTQALTAFTTTPVCGAELVFGGSAVGTANPTIWISAVSSSSVTVNASSNAYANGIAITCYGH